MTDQLTLLITLWAAVAFLAGWVGNDIAKDFIRGRAERLEEERHDTR